MRKGDKWRKSVCAYGFLKGCFFFYNGVNLSSRRILQQEFFGPTWQPPHIKSRVLGVTQRVHVQLSACASFKRVKLIHTIVKKKLKKKSQWSQFDVVFLIGRTTEDENELHMIEFIQKNNN